MAITSIDFDRFNISYGSENNLPPGAIVEPKPTVIDMIPFIVRSAEWYNYFLDTLAGGDQMHQMQYAVGNDFSGAVDFDVFFPKWPIMFSGSANMEWWKYKAAEQKFYHMHDTGDSTRRNGRYHCTWPVGAIGGHWLNRYMNVGDSFSYWNEFGTVNGKVTFYGNNDPDFVEGVINGDPTHFQSDPAVDRNGDYCVKTTFFEHGTKNFGGDVGTQEYIRFDWMYPSDVYEVGGKVIEEFTFAKGPGWVGWKMSALAPTGYRRYVNDQPYFAYKTACPHGTITLSTQLIVPHPYVPSVSEWNP